MTKPVFNNRENTPHVLEDGRIIWESRSCAVMAVIVASVNGKPYVALGKRGEGTPDEQGKFCLVCGYIDWDENAFDAVRREAWEEFGLDVSDETEWGYETQPWWVQSEPTANRQNITLRFYFRTHCQELPELSTENAEPGEVDEVHWVPLEEALEMDLAFKHHLVLKQFFNNRLSVEDDALWHRYEH